MLQQLVEATPNLEELIIIWDNQVKVRHNHPTTILFWHSYLLHHRHHLDHHHMHKHRLKTSRWPLPSCSPSPPSSPPGHPPPRPTPKFNLPAPSSPPPFSPVASPPSTPISLLNNATDAAQPYYSSPPSYPLVPFTPANSSEPLISHCPPSPSCPGPAPHRNPNNNTVNATRTMTNGQYKPQQEWPLLRY